MPGAVKPGTQRDDCTARAGPEMNVERWQGLLRVESRERRAQCGRSLGDGRRLHQATRDGNDRGGARAAVTEDAALEAHAGPPSIRERLRRAGGVVLQRMDGSDASMAQRLVHQA